MSVASASSEDTKTALDENTISSLLVMIIHGIELGYNYGAITIYKLFFHFQPDSSRQRNIANIITFI